MKHRGGPGPGPVPYVWMFWGFFLVLGWTVFYLFTGDNRRRIGVYELAEESCYYQRCRLLQEIDDCVEGANAGENNYPSPR